MKSKKIRNNKYTPKATITSITWEIFLVKKGSIFPNNQFRLEPKKIVLTSIYFFDKKYQQ